ncbi:MAG: hypothetical protein HN394_13280 [Rhodospirillaceae bacterium]|jgi:uncharacterized protein|nr:hypothetical protein [Rhodospirillaceae bacterium]MBT4691204.1 hypothetical protein [Rhodospirillaceae bacterium]MBT5082548.1 hypothetical protein [Rhodospirillaceae bacterium]MBT5879651.1 hypothetical protein [Rhodospirillaceae bacterium]MBT6985764.1 hypothetical protein [Rhodospirillaceae bacterium]
MAKSFLISLAGFAVGIGVTTALTFITPGLDLSIGGDGGEGSTVVVVPLVEQQNALLQKKPAPRRDTAASKLPPAPPKPSLEPLRPSSQPEPLRPEPSTTRTQAGPAMPAVKRPEIKTARLEKPAAAVPTVVVPAPEIDEPVVRPVVVDAAEAQRRERIEHENVRQANLTPPSLSPPASPPMPSTTTDDAPASNSISADPSAANASAGATGAPRSLAIAPQRTWQRFAALAPPAKGRAQVAIVLDDMGLSQFRSDRAIALPRPITLAILPYGNHLDGLVARARTAGHEILVHLPMEPQAADADPGPNALLTGLPIPELDRRIAANLARLDGYVGINNHMGSRFTASSREMRRVMRALQARDLLFLDSLTTGKSTGHSLAREFGIPTVVRDIFLDNDRNPAKILKQLERTAARARKNGYAIAIGHPYPETLNALESWLPGLAKRGIVLVPISALVKQRASGASGAPGAPG